MRKTDPIREGIPDLFIEEYKALRGEIDIYHDQQKDIINFLFIVFAIMLGIPALSINLPSTEGANFMFKVSFIFLIFPILYALLTFLYTDRTIRILRIADYLHNFLRIKVIRIFKMYVWQWETYKSHAPPLINRNVALFLDRTRWLIFVLPSIIALILYFVFSNAPGFDFKDRVLIGFDVILIFSSLVTMFIVEETKGIQHREIDLDKYEKNYLQKNS
ncbi:MAG: hypothetical protein WC626_09550 [Methanoregula sp.]